MLPGLFSKSWYSNRQSHTDTYLYFMLLPLSNHALPPVEFANELILVRCNYRLKNMKNLSVSARDSLKIIDIVHKGIRLR